MERIKKLLEFLEKEGEDSFLEHALALEYIKIGREDDALGLFCKLLKRDPGYVGSYYHLAKLLERKGNYAEAMEVYVSGMKEAKKAGDQHAYNELMMAKDELE